MQPGTIVIFNGPSASGKSTTQRAFQKIMEEPYIRLGIDQLFDTVLPDSFNLGGEFPSHAHFTQEEIRHVTYDQDLEGKTSIALHVGPIGLRVLSGMHHALRAYAEQGNHLVVDYILYDQDWLRDLVEVLQDQRVYFVGFYLPLEELERRESSRNSTPIGHARSHYHFVHGPEIYDIKVDVESSTPEEIAKEIKTFIRNTPEPEAFTRLRRMFR